MTAGHLAGRPLVPARHENELGIDFQSPAPLLGEIESLVGIGRHVVTVGFGLHAVMEAAADVRQRMLGYGYRHVLGPVGDSLQPTD